MVTGVARRERSGIDMPQSRKKTGRVWVWRVPRLGYDAMGSAGGRAGWIGGGGLLGIGGLARRRGSWDGGDRGEFVLLRFLIVGLFWLGWGLGMGKLEMGWGNGMGKMGEGAPLFGREG